MHWLEGVYTHESELVDDVPPDPRDQKPNKPQQLPDAAHLPLLPVRQPAMNKPQPEPVPKPVRLPDTSRTLVA